MNAYVHLVTLLSLAGFYVATFLLAGAIPTFVLQIDDGAAIRSTISTTLGVAITTLPLWYLHWHALRRLWDARSESGRGYLFLINSVAVLATAVMAGQLVRHVAALLLGTVPASDTATATLATIMLRFALSGLLWHYHWTLLRKQTDDRDVEKQKPVRMPAG